MKLIFQFPFDFLHLAHIPVIPGAAEAISVRYNRNRDFIDLDARIFSNESKQL